MTDDRDYLEGEVEFLTDELRGSRREVANLEQPAAWRALLVVVVGFVLGCFTAAMLLLSLFS